MTYHEQLIEQAKVRRAKFYSAGNYSSEIDIVSDTEAARRRWAAQRQEIEAQAAVRKLADQRRQTIERQAMRQAEIASAIKQHKGKPSVRSSMVLMQRIQRVVCQHYHVRMSELLSDRRPWSIVLPRHVAMYLCVQVTGRSLPFVGRVFGRDHTAIMHARNKIAAQRATDPAFDAELHKLEEQLGV